MLLLPSSPSISDHPKRGGSTLVTAAATLDDDDAVVVSATACSTAAKGRGGSISIPTANRTLAVTNKASSALQARSCGDAVIVAAAAGGGGSLAILVFVRYVSLPRVLLRDG